MGYKFNVFTEALDYYQKRSTNPSGGDYVQQLGTDSGVAQESNNIIGVAGGTGISTAGAGSTVTINMDSPVSVANGGTGRTSLTNGAMLIGDGTHPMEMVGPLADGQILIGDTTGFTPVPSTITAGNGISIANGPGSITISATGQSQGTDTAMANYIVDPSNLKAEYQTIQAAINAASANETVGIKPGTYTENLTLKAGVVLTSLGGTEEGGAVTIQGKATISSTGYYVIYGVQLTGNMTTPDSFLEITGTDAVTISLERCRLCAIGATGLVINNPNADVYLTLCDGDICSPSTKFFDVTDGKTTIERCRFTNMGASTTASTFNSDNIHEINYSKIDFPIEIGFFSGTDTTNVDFTSNNSIFDCKNINTTPIVIPGLNNIAPKFHNCNILSGTAVAISHDYSNIVITNSTIHSSSTTFAIASANKTFLDSAGLAFIEQHAIQGYQNPLSSGSKQFLKNNVAGEFVQFSVINEDNTSTQSNAVIEIAVNGPNAGDPFLSFGIQGTTQYSLGIDNTESNDPFKITTGSGLATPIIQIEKDGNVDFPLGTGYLKLPRGTTSEQPQNSSEGMVRANINNHEPEYYNGTEWKSIALGNSTSSQEGPFTPTLEFGGASTGITYSTQQGMYVRIGKLIWVNFKIVLTNKGTSTGEARLTGFPSFKIHTPVPTSLNHSFVVYNSLGTTSTGAALLGSFLVSSQVQFMKFLIPESANHPITCDESNFANNTAISGAAILEAD